MLKSGIKLTKPVLIILPIRKMTGHKVNPPLGKKEMFWQLEKGYLMGQLMLLLQITLPYPEKQELLDLDH